MANGRIKDYEVFVSSDGKNWGSAVKKGTVRPHPGEMQIVNFGRPVRGEVLEVRGPVLVREEGLCLDGGVGGHSGQIAALSRHSRTRKYSHV